MKSISVITALSLTFILVMPRLAQAQEMKAQKLENVEWKNIIYIKFKAGKAGEAKEIIKDHFMKASEKAGISPPEMMLQLRTGEWDHIAIWNLSEGPEAMEWDISPDNVKWFQALSELEGGPEKAQELWERYESCAGS